VCIVLFCSRSWPPLSHYSFVTYLVREGWGIVATRRSRVDFSLERIYRTSLKNPLADEAGVRGFSKLGFGSLLLTSI
jgi:hypothetical protein